jgi:hypothetical protein
MPLIPSLAVRQSDTRDAAVRRAESAEEGEGEAAAAGTTATEMAGEEEEGME